jgi:hypothetical protein
LTCILQAEELDEVAIKRMILSFEKKINQNQAQRLKFADQPEKYYIYE